MIDKPTDNLPKRCANTFQVGKALHQPADHSLVVFHWKLKEFLVYPFNLKPQDFLKVFLISNNEIHVLHQRSRNLLSCLAGPELRSEVEIIGNDCSRSLRCFHGFGCHPCRTLAEGGEYSPQMEPTDPLFLKKLSPVDFTGTHLRGRRMTPIVHGNTGT